MDVPFLERLDYGFHLSETLDGNYVDLAGRMK